MDEEGISRRGFLAGVAGVAGAVGGAGVAGVVLTESERGTSDGAWPMRRYDPAGTGSPPDAVGPKSAVGTAWQWRKPDPGPVDVDAPVSDSGTSAGGSPLEDVQLGSAPVLFGGRLYSVDGELVAFGADDGELTVREPLDGHYYAPAVADGPAYATPTVVAADDGGVVGLNASGGDGVGDRSFGTVRWRHRVGDGGTSSPPVPVGNTVYATVSGRTVALGTESGRRKWASSPGDGRTESRRPAVRDGRVYVANRPSGVAAYDARGGDRLWRHELPGDGAYAPTATPDGVVVPDRRGLTAVDADGSRRWRFDHGTNRTGAMAAVADGRAYVTAGPRGSGSPGAGGEDPDASDEDPDAGGEVRLYAVDLATGEPAWSIPVGASERSTVGLVAGAGPTVADGVVYVGRPALVAADAATRSVLWRGDTWIYRAEPVVAGGRLFLLNSFAATAMEGSE